MDIHTNEENEEGEQMKTKIPLSVADTIASETIAKLLPYCNRISVAGSIRRRKPEIGDIELVATPRAYDVDMFGATLESHSLDHVNWDGIGEYLYGGHKLKKIRLNQGVDLDLFIVTPPAQWGTIFLIRTGPDTFSHKYVTPRKEGGLLPSIYRHKEGAIWSHNHVIETPEEIDVFNLIGLPYIEPERRM